MAPGLEVGGCCVNGDNEAHRGLDRLPVFILRLRTTENNVMADRTRKRLVWDYPKDLITLPADELFPHCKDHRPVQGKDSLNWTWRTVRVCFKYINAFMSSESLLETEDQGMSGTVVVARDCKISKTDLHAICTSNVDTDTHLTHVSHPLTTDEQTRTTNGTYLTPPHAVTDLRGVKETEPRTSTDISKMLAEYETLSRKIRQYMTTPTQHTDVAQPAVQGGCCHNHIWTRLKNPDM